jgi:Putative sensor
MAVAGAGSGAAWRSAVASAVASAVRPVVSARTWLAVIHLLSGLVTGLAAFIVVLLGIVGGVALLAVLFAGLPVLAATLWLCLQFARAERARFAGLLGAGIPAPRPRLDPGAGWWRRTWRTLTAPATLRQVGYAVARFPLSVAEVIVVVAVWALAWP